jgi:hypothetical protein
MPLYLDQVVVTVAIRRRDDALPFTERELFKADATAMAELPHGSIEPLSAHVARMASNAQDAALKRYQDAEDAWITAVRKASGFFGPVATPED